MKLRLLSDLHLEFAPFDLAWGGEDVLVLAGDVCPGIRRAVRLLRGYLASAPVTTNVVVVCGNHDFYGGSIDAILADWAGIDLPRVWFLEDQSVVLHGLRFCGSTFWTDLPGVDIAVDHAALSITDFELIRDFLPVDFRAMHSASREWLLDAMDRSAEPVVVVTHHLPSSASNDPRYDGHATNACYCSEDCGQLLEHPRLVLWCHGHTHTSVDYELGSARVVCNPRGYVKMWKNHVKKRENPHFERVLILDV
jgi:predicted phosphodiesterase